MESLVSTLPGLLLAIAGILSPVITLILGFMQIRNKRITDEEEAERKGIELASGHASSIVATTKEIGAAWMEVIEETRNEISRIKEKNKELQKAIDELILENQALKELVNKQTNRISLLQEANKALADDIRKLKKDTGELKSNGK